LVIDKRQHGGDIVHHRRDRHLGPHRAHARAIRTPLVQHVGAENRIPPGAIIEVGQEHVVADGREPARHIAEFLADTGCIHQEEDGGKRPAALGTTDKGFHRAVCRGDVQRLFDHLLGS
jgi:hypothetical protein